MYSHFTSGSNSRENQFYFSSRQLLGVTIDNKLKFEGQIRKICRKVSQQVTVLNCLKKILPFELRIDLHPAFIAPRFNYCSESWHHCGKRVSGKLEKINKQALRFVTRDKSTTYETLLKQLNLLSPFNQRIVKMATGVYKAIHGYKVPRGIGELLQERSTNYNLRGKHILELPKVNKSPMVLNHGVILQLRFGTLFRIIFAALIKSEHLRT